MTTKEYKHLSKELENLKRVKRKEISSRIQVAREEGEYVVVPASDADILNRRITDDSPIGKALIGKRAGDEIKVHTPGGVSLYKIIKVINAKKTYGNPKNTRIKEKTELKDISYKDFLTRVSILHCAKEKHKVQDIRCKTRVLKSNGTIESVIIPGAYCSDCDKYYILDQEYNKLKQLGILLCRIVEKDYWLSSENHGGFANLNKESLLHIMGYNVNANVGLTQIQRWRILEIIVDEHILSTTEICSHLQWLIRRSSGNTSFSSARSKWQKDMNHIMNYSMEGNQIVGVKSIEIRKKRKG